MAKGVWRVVRPFAIILIHINVLLHRCDGRSARIVCSGCCTNNAGIKGLQAASLQSLFVVTLGLVIWVDMSPKLGFAVNGAALS